MTMFFQKPESYGIIRQLPLFCSLGWWDCKFIAEHSEITEYKKGDIIYNEGDAPDAFYYIINGRVQIFTREQNKKEIPLEYARRGDYFGTISLLTGDRHSVSTRIINDAVILKISKPDFEAILKRIPHLAVHFSKTLSRRLKRKDLHVKTIFESTIVSVYSPKKELGCSWYSINLGLSLKNETHKKVILVDVSPDGTVLFDFLDKKGEPLEEKQKDVPFDEKIIKEHIISHPFGLDIVGVSNRTIDVSHISSILSYLTNDYHYIVVDLPHEINDVVFKALTQADLIHLLFDPEKETLTKAKDILDKMGKTIPESNEIVKLCLVSELQKSDTESIEKMLGYNLYATIPHDGFIKETDSGKAVYKPSILIQPQTAYSRTIRRIAREIGGVLVGLALSSGAAYGLAHIGVIKVLEEENIPVDIVVGASMGALIAVFWASGKSGKNMEEIAIKYKSKWSLFKFLNFTFPRYGFISGKNILRFLHEHLGNKTFHDVTIPVKTVACNISNRERVILEHGSLAEAVRASISIPGVFKPFMRNKQILVDGAILSPVPVDVLTKLGINKIIAVNVIPSPEEVVIAREQLHEARAKKAMELKKKRPVLWLIYVLRRKLRRLLFPNIIDILMNSMHAMEYILAEMGCKQADIVIRATEPKASWFEFFNPVKLIKKGEEQTRLSIPQIKSLLFE